MGRRVFYLSKDITFEGSFVCGKDCIWEDGRQQWSKWICGGLKDVTSIKEWSKAAQFNFARNLK